MKVQERGLELDYRKRLTNEDDIEVSFTLWHSWLLGTTAGKSSLMSSGETEQLCLLRS